MTILHMLYISRILCTWYVLCTRQLYHFYSPQLFEANLETTFFFFLLSSPSDVLWKSRILCYFMFKRFLYVPNNDSEWFHGIWRCLVGVWWVLHYFVSQCHSLFFVIWMDSGFLVTFEAIFCSNNIWNFSHKIWPNVLGRI